MSEEKHFRALLYEPIHQRALELLRDVAEIRFALELDEDYLVDAVQDVHAIIVRANGTVSRRIIENAPLLQVIGRHGVGVEHIDLDAATERRVYVVNTPHANTESVAEHCVGMMIALSKRMFQSHLALRQGRWGVRYEYIGQELFGKTLGVIGFGRIGQRVAAICHKVLGMTILYYDVVEYPKAGHELGARRASLEELLAEADYVSLHVPLLPGTRHLIGAQALELMKPTAYLLNTARGPIVDEKALVDALRAGKIAGAGLDVFEVEPPAAENPLFGLDNVIVTPHMAGHTEEALLRMGMVVRDVVRVLKGQNPEHWVNRWQQ